MDLPECSGIISDHFFYIGELPVVSKPRINWQTDSPPDLAIDCDITSFGFADFKYEPIDGGIGTSSNFCKIIPLFSNAPPLPPSTTICPTRFQDSGLFVDVKF